MLFFTASFLGKPSFFQRKKNKFGPASRQNSQGKSSYDKGTFSKGKRPQKKGN